jgi:hypothetical protein
MDFELTPPPGDVKPANARQSTKDLYDEWMKYNTSHGAHHPFTTEAYAKYRASLEAGKKVR